jgi:hypothetical protein
MKKFSTIDVIVYVVIFVQFMLLIYTLDLLSEKRFSSYHMWFAYRAGCQMGSSFPLKYEDVQKCNSLAETFKSILDASPMEQTNEK